MASLREGLPLVLLEALHAGRPVVATRLSAVTGVVRDGREARLADPGSAISLAAAIDGMLSDVATARAMAETGRERARREFSMERVASNYLELYGALKRRRRR